MKVRHNKHALFLAYRAILQDFVWNYVIIDDRIPVFGFNDRKAGKPYFARCRSPDELWLVNGEMQWFCPNRLLRVPLIEKAYAKLHGSYESLIGGYIDVALNDLSGLCSEQIIMKEGHAGTDSPQIS